MEVLKPLSEIFLVSFSILYGIMLNACIGQNLFPFGQLSKNPKVKCRVMVSFIIVNIVPMIVFAIVFTLLENVTTKPSFPNVIGIFLISFIVFTPYRFLQAIIVRHSTCLYQKREINRIFEKIPLELQTVSGHLWGATTYLLLAIVGLLVIIFS
jgi:nitrogen fixation/metabolism regulation signal transduction histidine kinase